MTRHSDCLSVLTDSARFASDWRRAGEDIPAPLLSVQTLDPPEHTAIRHLLLDGFRAQDRQALHAAMDRWAGELLAELAGRPSFDFVGELAEPLALRFITAFLGVDAPDPAWFVPMSRTVVDGMDAGLWPEKHEPAVAARARLAEYAGGWLADPPKDGLIGYVAAHAESAGVDRSVLRNSLRVVLHAGYESASRLLGNAAAALLTYPGALAAFRTAPLAAAVDELIRYDAPVQADARVCVTETELAGVTIRVGDPVTLFLGAAHHDPLRFAHPTELRLDRAPNPHLGFGRGAHACLGASLAIRLAGSVFTALARDYPDARAVAEPAHRSNLTLRGLDRFEVTLRPHTGEEELS
ncbi:MULTISPECIES: cytochrome P450 [unclassified Streptomyces]|uniref:cytochrome P450 n=1 Tax=unclassified Streptomyces TaxID=2593676 RepID=UPI00225B938D|nr:MULTISPECIES: cytochrome P450 [unclassified Streptomyces]MCX4529392.1 cytochrome P450 [Streptomyces sp. NBC_01551]MCX4540068.1 cytochrome P450 [Streptomyces sp. NBC_01565]